MNRTSTPNHNPAAAAALAHAAMHSPFGMVRLSTSPADQFLMHQARMNAAAAAALSTSSTTPTSMPATPPSSSEDKNSSTSSSSGGETPMSRTNQYKKVMKPLLERKRRARINKCLDELKDIMTVALQAQGENVSKLEKADILELTVRHLHKLQQSQRLMPRNPLEEVQRFQAGYSSCAQEAASFLLQTPGVDVRISQKLLNHLSSNSTSAALAATTTSQQQQQQLLQRQQQQHTPPTSSPPGGEFNLTGFHSPPPDNSSPIILPQAKVPPRPASNPEPKTTTTLGTFTVAFAKADSAPSGCEDDDDDEDEVTTEGEDEKASKVRPIKPAALRLNPNDPVWRPF